MHPVWSRTVNEQLAALGLDFFGGYVAGRASLLGEPATGVVVASFAVFESAFLGAVYGAARVACPRDELARVREAATIASLEDVLTGCDVAATADALGDAAAAADGTGRPLFSGLRDQPWPASPVGRLWRACELLREHRGDSHVAVSVGRGLDPVAMNVLTELWVGMPLGSYTATRGWSESRIAASVAGLQHDGLVEAGALTAAGRRFRDDIETATDALQAPIVDALGDRLDDVVDRLDDWSGRCIAARAFPPDVFKRAAG